MKKTFILILSLFMTLGAFAQQYSDWSRWSITLEGGLNRFDGDVKQDYGREVIPTGDTKITFGGALEYTLTPVWSIGLDYYYLPLSADTRPEGGVYSFETKMHNVSFFTSFNLLKAFFQKSNSKWGLWGGFGLGYSMHKVDYQTDNVDGVMINTKWGKFADADYTNDKGRSMFVPLHLLLEYNFTKCLALGAKAQYRGYFVDDIDGRFRPNANDALELGTLQLRYKFNARNKDHTRNISLAQYRGDVEKTDLDRLQDQINGIVIPADPTERLDDLDRRVQKLEDILCPDDPDTDGDGVPDCRDKEPDTPAGNQVDFWGRTIKTTAVEEIFDEKAFIYFEFDKTDLDSEALKAVQITAEKLKADPTLIVEVRGFTDNMGTDEYNLGLSQRRADTVKEALINAHGIEADRIIANGKGKFNPNDKIAKYKPYRTCVFFYNK